MAVLARDRNSDRSNPSSWSNRESYGSLTIVSLVGQGLTNSEIAQRLVVSRRTVESHLVRVYPKLQLGSRPQLAAIAAVRHTTVEPPTAPDIDALSMPTRRIDLEQE